ncbi:hypothetical protein HPB50_028362 [Hyalomma asiaticum]|nr:hypothetical protein HPB50_028362 [Hyalomma asiaticum]
MFAFVQYQIDSTTDILECKEIENFRPKNVADFDSSEIRQAYWYGDEGTEGGYYAARVLHLTGTWAIKKTKKRSPKKNERDFLKEVPDESTSTTVETVPKADYDALQQRLSTVEEELQRIKDDLSSRNEIALIGGNQEQPNGCTCRTEPYSELRDEVKELRALNAELQRSLLAKIFSAGAASTARNSEKPPQSKPSQPSLLSDTVDDQVEPFSPQESPVCQGSESLEEAGALANIDDLFDTPEDGAADLEHIIIGSLRDDGKRSSTSTWAVRRETHRKRDSSL